METSLSAYTLALFTIRAWSKSRFGVDIDPAGEALARHTREAARARQRVEELRYVDPLQGYIPVPEGEAP